MKYLHITVPILLSGLLFATGHLQAAPFNPMVNTHKKPANNYLGASIGMNHGDGLCGSLNSCDDGAKSWKAYSGVRLNDNVVVEGGYIQFGELAAVDANGSRTVSELSGYTTAGIAAYRYSDQIELFGKGGMIWWDNETADNTGSSSTDGSNTFVGIGANYDMGDNMGIKAEWERFEGIQRFQNQPANSLDLLSVGFIFSSL